MVTSPAPFTDTGEKNAMFHFAQNYHRYSDSYALLLRVKALHVCEGFTMKLSYKLSVMLIVIVAIGVICKPVKTRLNENLAIATLKTIREAQQNFRQAQGRYATLSELVQAGLLSSAFKEGRNWGYRFDMKVMGERYHVVAV